MKTTVSLLLLSLLAVSAWAKLPPPSDEAKAKAAEAAAKTAWAGKVDAYKLCLAQDRTAAHLAKGAKADKSTKPAPSTCADPGPFVSTAAGAAPAAAASAPATVSAPPAKAAKKS